MRKIETIEDLETVGSIFRYHYDDISETSIYLYLYREIPKFRKCIDKINVEALDFLKNNGTHLHTYLTSVDIDDEQEYGIHVFIYKHSVIELSLNENSGASLEILTNDLEVLKEFYRFKIEEEEKGKEAYFGIVLQKNSGLAIKRCPIAVSDFDLELNYGESFVSKNEAILHSLENNTHGLYLFHGPPGTGKTTYIKYLSSLLGEKRKNNIHEEFGISFGEDEESSTENKGKLFVYLPTSLMNSVVDPSFATLLLEQKNDIVLILEDAEEYIQKREEFAHHSAVSTLLNLTDGIMGSILNVSIVVTFNFNMDKIDSALRRKGRLFAEHSFDNLSVEEAQKLLDHLKIDYKATNPMSLADIYNAEFDNFAKKEKEQNKIGFGL